MTITPLATTVDPGVVLFDGPDALDLSYASLATAIGELREVVQNDEHTRLRAARIVDAIDRQQLYREAGFPDMKAFLPSLCEQLAGIGWRSDTSIKRYLAFYRLYIKQMALNGDLAIRAVSHLHELYKLAKVDSKTGELVSPESAGKLEPETFEDVVCLISWLVAAPSKEQKLAGLPADQLAPLLEAAGLKRAAETYKELCQTEVALPPKGWTLAHTKALITCVAAADDEEASDDKYVQVWVGEETFDGAVSVEEIQWRTADGNIIEVLPVQRVYTIEQFKRLKGAATSEIKGQKGEQNTAE